MSRSPLLGRVGALLAAPAVAAGLCAAPAATAESLTQPSSPPAAVSPPVISGLARVGNELLASPGTWNGTEPIEFRYRWQRCESSSRCRVIGRAVEQTYTVDRRDVGVSIRVIVAAANREGRAFAASRPTEPVAPAPSGAPVNRREPGIDGSPVEGQTLTWERGSWEGSNLTYETKWLRCGARGGACSEIPSATAERYTLTPADVGWRILLRVVARNSVTSTTAFSDPSKVVVKPASPDPPENKAPPRVSGKARLGETLSGDRGRWEGTGPIQFVLAWQRCDQDGRSCGDVRGANGGRYRLQSEDATHRIRLRVTATNAAGSTDAYSEPTEVVQPAGQRPVNTAAPFISGTPPQGRLLTANRGRWTGSQPINFAYQWQRCDRVGGSCSDIGGAAGQTYRLGSADANQRVRIRVTATNVHGSAVAFSHPTPVVQGTAPPVNVSPPTTSGSAVEGGLLTAFRGGWTGNPPPSFVYQWLRCDANGNGCASIGGATGHQYRLTRADIGRRLRVRVTGSNSEGSANATSAPTGIVQAAGRRPVNTSPPTTFGTEREGAVLTATPGTWRGSPAPTFAYQWLRCDQNGSSCLAIGGATARTYRLEAADVGHRMRVRVTARNSAGSASADSAASPVVAGAGTAPANTSAPTISGNPVEGQVLTASRGQWSGTQPLSFAYRWQRCDRSGGSCADIVGAFGLSWRLTAAEVGHTIHIRVVATNSRGSGAAISRETGVVVAAGGSGTQIRLPDGKISIPVANVSPPRRLVISRLQFRPNPLRHRRDLITARFRITDTRGYVIRGALVFVIPLPYGWTTQPAEVVTGVDGWATVRMRATRRLPRRGAIVMFVRARKPGDSVLTGVSTRRLVQMLVALR